MKVKEYLVEFLSSVYCDTCANQDDENKCDYCHRKSMNWALSEQTAETMAKEIANLTTAST